VVPGTTPMFFVERLREEGATVEICGKVSCMFILPELHLNFEHKDSHKDYSGYGPVCIIYNF